MTFEQLKDKANSLPLVPGVYIMRDRSDNVIYVGKAKKLKNRVSQYFQDTASHSPKTRIMVSHIDHFDVIAASSEFEALILECSLIKRYLPKYNILLKDDKGYHYIRVTPPPFSRITAEVNTSEAGEYLGPYMSGFVTKQTVGTVNRLFQLPTCGKPFPAAFGKQRPCLNYHIGQCMGVCRGKISASAYAETIADAVRFIRNGGDRTIETLEQRMRCGIFLSGMPSNSSSPSQGV